MSGYTPEDVWKPHVEQTAVRIPGEATQVGCVYCLAENVDSPATGGIVYYWNGTSMCGTHIKKVVGKKE